MNEMRKLMEMVVSNQENFSIEFEYDHTDPEWIGWAYRDSSGKIMASGNDEVEELPEIISNILAGLRPES